MSTPTGPEHEPTESELLAKGAEAVARTGERIAEDQGTVDTVAKAVFAVKDSAPYLVVKAAWELLPAGTQRNLAMADHNALGEFLLKYFPAVHPEAWFPPSYFAAGFISCGLLNFKLTKEEEGEMAAQLGSDASETQKMAFRAEKQKTVIAKVVIPGEGYMGTLDSKPLRAATTLEPELAPIVVIGKAGGMIQGAREGFFENVRAQVHALEVAAQEAKEAEEVPTVATTEHDEVAAADVPAHIPPIRPAGRPDAGDAAHM
ncbi:MAG: hypothetical protein WC924_03415 [Candidatus Gracilibacteria bacterium]